MKQEAYNLAAYAVEQFVTEMEISKHIKAQFDEKYGPTWHCVVGSDFKLQCTHEAKHSSSSTTARRPSRSTSAVDHERRFIPCVCVFLSPRARA